jgi:hypothetical protein
MEKSTYNILVRTPEGKRSLGKPKNIQEDNIKKNLKETGCQVMD